MRIWDIAPEYLCRNHLLGEHRELHALWTIITNNKKGYSKHPETLRWIGKLKALYLRHQELVFEMTKRSYSHQSDLDVGLATGNNIQDDFVTTPDKQKIILRLKKCQCRV